MAIKLNNLIVSLLSISTLIVLPTRAESPAGAEDLDALLATYRSYGLPLPPPDAPLVRFVSGQRFASGQREEPIDQLAFRLSSVEDGKVAVVLAGTEQHMLSQRSFAIQIVRPEDALADRIEPVFSDSTFPVNAGLATAIQCKARGWDGLAKALLAQSLKVKVGQRFSIFFQPIGLPPKTAMAYLAWARWGNELIRPGTNRAEIANRIRQLFASEPALSTKPNISLLHSLDAALMPSTAAPGSIEAMIDDLAEVSDVQGRAGEHDPRYSHLSLLGFQAVPALIDHLDDQRLTRSVMPALNNFPAWIRRVGDVAGDLLQELAADDLGRDWLDRQKGVPIEQAAAQQWWAKARATGEEAYALAHVLPDGPKEQWPNSALLQIIAARYPAHLPELYRTILDRRPSLQSWPMAKALAASGLTRAEKISLFVHAADNANLEHRRAAYWELKALDPEVFVSLLIKTLDGLPATPQGSYWNCREASFANLVIETDDPRAWAALERAARRADVGLRMEYINPMNYTYVGKKQRRQRIEFLSAFLSDTSVRDVASDPKRFDGPFAGFGFPHLAVADLAAMKIASILKLPIEPTPDAAWTPEQWKAFRARAQEAARYALSNDFREKEDSGR